MNKSKLKGDFIWPKIKEALLCKKQRLKSFNKNMDCGNGDYT